MTMEISKNLCKFLLTAVFLFTSMTASAASLEEAKAAYKNKDYEIAVQEFLPLAEAGDPVAQFYIGLMLDAGDGVPQNYQKALEWYGKAAAQGYIPAQANLGVLYESGVDQNYAMAEKWYLKAAEQGDATSQANLGTIYYIGHGAVKRDHSKAAFWYAKAAEQGNPVAQNGLSNMYEYGQSVQPDLVKAYKWLTLAAAAGNETAEDHKKDLEEKMNPAQMEEGKKQAQEWLSARNQKKKN
ncbi:MAG: tetratricopeptide repeat protein [Pseudomonadota bacterium]